MAKEKQNVNMEKVCENKQCELNKFYCHAGAHAYTQYINGDFIEIKRKTLAANADGNAVFFNICEKCSLDGSQFNRIICSNIKTGE